MEQDPKVQIAHDDRLGAIWASCVKAKGPCPEVVTRASGNLEEAGYRGVEISIKTDQEESIMALKRAIAARRQTQTSMMESKVRVPKSNAQVWASSPKVARTVSQDQASPGGTSRPGNPTRPSHGAMDGRLVGGHSTQVPHPEHRSNRIMRR